MLSIGITGGMGSGKTTCCEIFTSLGVPVYNADMRGKFILQENAHAKEKLLNYFGKDIFDDKGILDRKKLAAIVFNNTEKLRILEGIVHPAVQEDFADFRRAHFTAKYIVKEAALLYESGTYKDLDKIIVVDAPMEIRLKRIMERDGISSDEIMARIEKQWPDEKKLEMADYIIQNDDRELLLPQVLKLHEMFLNYGLLA